jgi:Fe-S cluster biogenesis protein NfuA
METVVAYSLEEKVEIALNQIRPYLKSDGGDVRIIEITDDKTLRIELLGACGSCSMSAMTFRGGIEDTIRREVPEILKVIAINVN